MTFVYILSDYEEHGAQHVTATLNRDALMGMIDKYPYSDEQKDIYRRAIAERLLESDEKLSAYDGENLSDGWGGMQLHVVKLDAPPPR